MTTTNNATAGRIGGLERATADLLDVQALAGKLNCSVRTCYRLADAGKMPRPVKLGALVRWSRETIDEWIAEGCPPVRSARGGSR